MVKETRIIFDVNEVKYLRVLCKKCGAETLYNFGTQPRPFACSACNTSWNPGTNEQAYCYHFHQLMETLKSLKSVSSEAMDIRFEIEGEQEKQS